jgi:polyisoprenoid-binding protein YceI
MRHHELKGKTVTQSESNADDLSQFVGDWTLDPEATSVTFRTKAMWVFPVKGTMKALSGEAHVSADAPVRGTLVIDAASVDTKNKKRDIHLRTKDFFEVEAHPTLVYTANGGHQNGADEVDVTGELTVVGKSQPVTLHAKVNVSGNTATLTTQVEIDRSQWGLNWAKMGAGLKNQVEIEAHFNRA